jgi:hypothetical protein
MSKFTDLDLIGSDENVVKVSKFQLEKHSRIMNNALNAEPEMKEMHINYSSHSIKWVWEFLEGQIGCLTNMDRTEIYQISHLWECEKLKTFMDEHFVTQIGKITSRELTAIKRMNDISTEKYESALRLLIKNKILINCPHISKCIEILHRFVDELIPETDHEILRDMITEFISKPEEVLDFETLAILQNMYPKLYSDFMVKSMLYAELPKTIEFDIIMYIRQMFPSDGRTHYNFKNSIIQFNKYILRRPNKN